MFVKQYYEENNPAFQKIKEDKELYTAYKRAVAQIFQQASGESNTDLCSIYFNQYLRLLKDHHSSIDFNLQRKNIDLSSQAVIDSFKASPSFKAFPLRKIDTMQVMRQLKNKPLDDIEGFYSQGGTLVAVIQHKEGYYEGVVVKKNALLDVGHVLFTLTREKDNYFTCAYNLGLLGFNFNTAVIEHMRVEKGGIPMMGYYKNGADANKPLWEFKELDADTYYLSIKSFEYGLRSQFDSLYEQIIPKIAQKKFLILDIRDNGGGSEENYFKLLPLIYTKPMKVDEVQVWVSPNNIKSYQGTNEDLMSRMEHAQPFSFIPQKEHGVRTLEYTGTRFPEKIVVLYNKVTASAAEGLITYAIQSDKVVTMGENSGGFMGYGDIKAKEIPCGKFKLNTTTTKYKENSKYEFVGIPPMVRLDREADWVKAAVGKLNERK
ncbi:S41 family peptidase [Chitinophaga agrisoli]|uniref:S41 family peptidase n=1 Tax=Chitinophaga agrisoli TaxID=2607653 RepID=UPI001661D862|nr:S41 family peptidase [Chitinophaga agrisoli]